MSWHRDAKCEGQCCGCSRDALKGKAARQCSTCKGDMCDHCGTAVGYAGMCRECIERCSPPSWMTSGRHG